MNEPRMFSVVRKADESGVSGTGRVVDGVLFHTGQVVICWRTDIDAAKHGASSLGVYASWADFKFIHIDSHPTNETEIEWQDTPTRANLPNLLALLNEQKRYVPVIHLDESRNLSARMEALTENQSAFPCYRSNRDYEDLEGQLKRVEYCNSTLSTDNFELGERITELEAEKESR